jgi:hypothetical protein
MGLGKRLETGRIAFQSTFYLEVIGKDIKKLTEAKFRDLDQKTIRKSLQALVKNLRKLEPNVLAIVASVDSSNIIEYHRALVTSAETHLKALDDVEAQTDRADTWNPLYLAMRGWCELMKSLDLYVNPRGGAVTQALDLLWRYPSGEANSEGGPATDNRPRFLGLLTTHFMGMQAEKKLLGREFVRNGPMLTVGSFLFETGAILGGAFKDRLYTFLIPFCAKPSHNMLDEFLPGNAKRIAASRKGVETINELFMVSEMRRQQPGALASAWSTWMLGQSDKRMSPQEARAMAAMCGTWGAGYGAYYTQEFADLYLASYGSIDLESWHRLYKAGVGTEPEPPPFVPLEDRQKEAVTEFSDFVREHYPELVSELSI